MRKTLMLVAGVFNVLAMILSIVACFAMSTSFDVVSSVGFTTGEVKSTADSPTSFDTVDISIGLKGIAVENPNEAKIEDFVKFDEFCDVEPGSPTSVFFPPEDCEECDDQSAALVSMVIISAVVCIFSINTNILRSYPNYDVNCQKFMGILGSLLGLVMSSSVLGQYSSVCFDSFYDGTISYDAQGNVVDPTDLNRVVTLDFSWKMGAGFACLLVATLLKAVDLIANIMLPTPNIVRDKQAQEEYEGTETADS